jgi:hypothetical protein
MNCECDWAPFHHGRHCTNDAADHGPGITTSPALCIPCLFVCEGERDDLEDPKDVDVDA